MEDEEEDPAALLLSDQLMDEDEDEDEIYEMADDTVNFEEDEDRDEIIAGTPEQETSFYLDKEEVEDDGFVQENPFEPVYPATAALLGSEENVDALKAEGGGMVLEAVSLDNILPAGSRRRHH